MVLLYGWVCFRHAISQFAAYNLLYWPKFLKKMLIRGIYRTMLWNSKKGAFANLYIMNKW